MRNYIIIGGSSGIGKELVDILAKQDSSIFATYNTNASEQLQNVRYIHLDVTKDILNLDILPEEIHGLAYCPGTINLKPFHRFSDDDFRNDFELQVLGATKIIKQLLPRIRRVTILLFFSSQQ